MRLCSIASGSSGNCIYVGSEETHVLVDTGISGKLAGTLMRFWSRMSILIISAVWG